MLLIVQRGLFSQVPVAHLLTSAQILVRELCLARQVIVSEAFVVLRVHVGYAAMRVRVLCSLTAASPALAPRHALAHLAELVVSPVLVVWDQSLLGVHGRSDRFFFLLNVDYVLRDGFRVLLFYFACVEHFKLIFVALGVDLILSSVDLLAIWADHHRHLGLINLSRLIRVKGPMVAYVVLLVGILHDLLVLG